MCYKDTMTSKKRHNKMERQNLQSLTTYEILKFTAFVIVKEPLYIILIKLTTYE